MAQRTKILIGVAVAVVVVVAAAVLFGPRLYAQWANDKAEPAPTLSTSGEIPDDVASYTGTLTVAEGSTAGYQLDEVLQGEDVTVRGSTEQVTGTLEIAEGTLESAEIEVDMASVGTDSGNRDAYFRDTALETDQFPTATFALTDPVALEPGASTVTLAGELTVHGVTQQVSLEAQVAVEEDRAEVVGSIPITFADFGVTAPNLGFVKVEETGTIEVDLFLAEGE
ncbi:polyisoprenoid-binding protein [Microbacterium nanhaiense]|uniref:Polyisoprenoid-binding protein n=1 Tax=Microbacterium nanhaiense TaxID=1301026 RepID=A0ABQ2N7X3_9MICO|nr:YceI family protein [Microbacterium nanhaiense]GGO66395.1 polyisoprenoid-binding protein [Microbacterium nanhaiense]